MAAPAPRRGGGGGRDGLRPQPAPQVKLNVEEIDSRTWRAIRRFISDRGKIRSRRVAGLSRLHQRQLALAVKRAREVGLLPYVGERS